MKINWFNSEKYCSHWWFSEKANHWFNQWKFDWFRFRKYIYQIFSQIFYKQKKLCYIFGLTYNFCHVTCLAHGLKGLKGKNRSSYVKFSKQDFFHWNFTYLVRNYMKNMCKKRSRKLPLIVIIRKKPPLFYF